MKTFPSYTDNTYYKAVKSQYLFEYRRNFKRLFDLVLILLSLPVVLPLILFLALLVRRDGGAAFFGHTRIGRNGVSFQCWKLRSMIADSGLVLQNHLKSNPKARMEWALSQKLSHDPRVTPFGDFLRRSSLDELPQLWNVLKGEMSLVGPRPVTAEEIQRYANQRGAYMACRPGLTGLWQVGGRNDVSYDARVSMDVEYNRAMCLWLDIRIISRTFGVILARSGR